MYLLHFTRKARVAQWVR